MNTLLTLHDPRTARRYHEDGVWREDTLYTLLRNHARERPGAYALRDSRWRLTWSQLLSWVDVLAADLHRADRAGLPAINRLQWEFRLDFRTKRYFPCVSR